MSPVSPFPQIRVASIEEWDRGLKTVRLDLTPEPFTAGQFFQLALDRHGKMVKRSYSAASAPGEPLEFFLSLVENGELTPGLFDLNVGDTLGVDPKALGFFTLGEVPPCETLWLVSTGTGLGPYISMLRQGRDLARFARLVVVHGARSVDQLAYRAELESRAESDPRLTYVPVVSRSEAPAGGLAGRITTAFASGALEERAQSKIDPKAHVLFCGNPQMIEEMVAALKERGLHKHKRREPGHFNFEKYW
jgi:ferredoxin/flavodoxin---NADP+ reductase